MDYKGVDMENIYNILIDTISLCPELYKYAPKGPGHATSVKCLLLRLRMMEKL